MSTIKVFQLNDVEWWAGESLEVCLESARKDAGDDCYPDEDVDGEVSPEAMQKLKFRDEDGEVRTFAQHLQCEIDVGTKFPCLFASTEW